MARFRAPLILMQLQFTNICSVCIGVPSSTSSVKQHSKTHIIKKKLFCLFFCIASHIIYILLSLHCRLEITVDGTLPVSILYKSIAGRHRPVRVADGPMTARFRFIKNASWANT